jgi:hypothetical protein
LLALDADEPDAEEPDAEEPDAEPGPDSFSSLLFAIFSLFVDPSRSFRFCQGSGQELVFKQVWSLLQV